MSLNNWMIKHYNLEQHKYAVDSNVPRICWYNLQELLLWIKKMCLLYFVTFGMLSEGNSTKNGEQTVGFSFTTMLQHTGRFWSRISYQRTTWQHWNILHILLTWLQLGFTCSLDWKQHWRGGASVVLLTSFRMRGRAEQVFMKWFPGMFPTYFQSLTKMCTCTRGPFWRKFSLNEYCRVFLRNKVIPGTSWSYYVHPQHSNP